MRIERHLKVVFAVLLLSPVAFGQTANDSDLVVRGSVTSLRLVSSDRDSVRVDVGVELLFFNKATAPIIVLRPGENLPAQMYWQGGQTLSLTRTHAERNQVIWSFQAWPAVNMSREFRQFAERLDQKAAPADLTLTLGPQETWKWMTVVHMGFYAKTSSCCSSADLGWEVISKIDVPLWFRLYYGIWSPNLVRADRGLRKRLQHRWNGVGHLFASNDLITEPIELRLNEMNRADGGKSAAVR
jgi:hypothetical protein